MLQGNRQQTTGNKQQATGFKATGNRQQATDNIQQQDLRQQTTLSKHLKIPVIELINQTGTCLASTATNGII
jgi:hypothetical protein